jgi:hypothetical protein
MRFADIGEDANVSARTAESVRGILFGLSVAELVCIFDFREAA